MAVGALCSTVSIGDDVVASIADKSVQLIKSRSSNILQGLSCLYSLVVSSVNRLDSELLNAACAALVTVFGFTTDRVTILWALRCVGALAQYPAAQKHFKFEGISPLLKRISKNDDHMQSSAHYVVEQLKAHMPSFAPAKSYEEFWLVPSNMTSDLGFFDCDIDDEYFSGSPIVV